jgi:anti-sigma regulatory factor (Ser/Thr protein kinase)
MAELAEEIVLRLPLAPDAELRAVDALDRMLERHRVRHQVQQRAAGQARFALIEACLNAIEYGRPATQEQEMDVRLALEGDELRISVDNPGGLSARSSAPRRGHGLKIIHAFMDRVRYFTDGRGTRVEMVKRLA